MRIYVHSLFHFIPIWTNLNETHLPYSCGIEMILFNDEKLKKSNLRLLKSSVRIYARSLFHFIPIWTNLNETQLPYSCDIEMIFFNVEKLKKIKSETFKILCAHLCAQLIPFHSNLDESEQNSLTLLLWHRNDIFQR